MFEIIPEIFHECYSYAFNKIKQFVPSTELWWPHKIFFKIIFTINEFSVGRKQEKPAAKSRFYFFSENPKND
jgi:hypothetical protein